MTTGNRVVRLQARLQARPQLTSPPPVRAVPRDDGAAILARVNATVASARATIATAREVLAMRQERLDRAGAVQHQDARVEGMRRNRELQRQRSMGLTEADIAAAARIDAIADPADRMAARRELQRQRSMGR